jgi:hypothetical protein
MRHNINGVEQTQTVAMRLADHLQKAIVARRPGYAG